MEGGGGGGGGGGGTPDTSPPKVLYTNPPNNAVGVAHTAAITVTFDKPIDPASATENLIVFENGTPLGGTVSVSGSTVRFHPEEELGTGKEYEAVVRPEIADRSGNQFNAHHVWRFRARIDEWRPITSTDAPEPRRDHSAVWTGTEMIVWGGQGSGTYLGDGKRYNPETDSWGDLAVGGSAPSARSNHTAVWTGTSMVVWGGTDSLQQWNDGRIYTPPSGTGSGSWATIPPPGGLSPRELHTALWAPDRNEMIVWGGRSGVFLLFNTGARFNPATGKWLSTRTEGAPSGRVDHTAVWTGREMIVWGGNDGTPRNDGAIYDPAADSWRPITTSGAPSARSGHTAIWTGTKMIVWGGSDGLPKNDGAIYDPATDTWRPMSITNAPTARSGHTAVWTGTEMIVWGGVPDGSGGAYDPESDQWRPLSTTGPPPDAAGIPRSGLAAR
ncbi:MAG TPA: Ig-like domain-containing protein [Burkholderiales bacterium]